MAIEFHRDGPWALPEGWVWARLGQLGRWTGGGTPSKANGAFWENGKIPWVSPKDMKVDVIGETEDFITPEAVTNSATKLVSLNSILMVVRSGILKHTFPVALTDRDVTINQDMRALSPFEGIDPGYLTLVLRRFQRHVLNECSKDGTTVASVEPALLEQTWVPIAPTNEQRRIVTRIDELFTDIADGETALIRALDDLDTWRRALLKSAVTGELTREWRKHNKSNETGKDVLARIASAMQSFKPTKTRGRQFVQEPLDDRLIDLPKGWEWSSLGAIGELVGGVTVDKKRRPSDPVTVPYLRVANVQRGYLDLSEMKSITVERAVAEALALKKGDILLNEGGDRDKIGRGWVWDGQIEGCIHQNHVFRLRPYDPAINPRFISHFANEMGRRFFVEKGKQTTNLASISMSKIGQLPIPVLPPAELQEAMRLLDDGLLALIDVEAELAAANVSVAARQSILKAAFDGRLVEQDADDEPADRLLARINDSGPQHFPATRPGRRSRTSLGASA
jgi:type I restriction enzyme S subunit